MKKLPVIFLKLMAEQSRCMLQFFYLQGEAKFLTESMIWWNTRADGIVRMKEG